MAPRIGQKKATLSHVTLLHSVASYPSPVYLVNWLEPRGEQEYNWLASKIPRMVSVEHFIFYNKHICGIYVCMMTKKYTLFLRI
jgi:hypothetical protein